MKNKIMLEIFDAIREYAPVYKKLDELQRKHQELIPIGDQKTGAIAEFYARIYARHKFPKATIEFSNHSQHAWDIKVIQEGASEIKVQVKAVSAYSLTSGISPIHTGWDELWLMRLKKDLTPDAFWAMEANKTHWSGKSLKSRTMPKRSTPGSGSDEFKDAVDETETFLKVLKTAGIAPDTVDGE